MSRDLSMKAVKINGHRVRCQICKKHDAVERYLGVLVCRRCLRPMIMGFFIGRLQPIPTVSKNETVQEVKEE